MERLVTDDPIGGRRVVLHEDAVTGELIQETTADVTELIETNKYEFNTQDKRTAFIKRNGLVKAASIPIDLWFKIKKEGIVDDPVRYRRWLNDPDNRFFRTVPGKV